MPAQCASLKAFVSGENTHTELVIEGFCADAVLIYGRDCTRLYKV